MKTATAERREGEKMKLITAEIDAKVPKLCANGNKAPEDTPVIAKFFNLCGAGTWYMTEYDPEAEPGYFSIWEIEEVDLPRPATLSWSVS